MFQTCMFLSPLAFVVPVPTCSPFTAPGTSVDGASQSESMLIRLGIAKVVNLVLQSVGLGDTTLGVEDLERPLITNGATGRELLSEPSNLPINEILQVSV